MMVGVPGSGKSTWIKNQHWLNDCVVVSTDAFVEDYAKECGKTYSEVFKDYMPTAVKLMIDKVVLARELGKNIVWDQTSVSIATRAKKIRMLPGYYKVAVVIREPDAVELKRRLASRPGKEVPWSVIDQMRDSWEDPTENEGFDEIWYAE